MCLLTGLLTYVTINRLIKLCTNLIAYYVDQQCIFLGLCFKHELKLIANIYTKIHRKGHCCQYLF